MFNMTSFPSLTYQKSTSTTTSPSLIGINVPKQQHQQQQQPHQHQQLIKLSSSFGGIGREKQKHHNRNRSNSNNIKSDIDSSLKSLLNDNSHDIDVIGHGNNSINNDNSIIDSNSSIIDNSFGNSINSSNEQLPVWSPNNSYNSDSTLIDSNSLRQLANSTFENPNPIKTRLKYMWDWFVDQVRTSTYKTWIKVAVGILVIVGICLAFFVFKLQHHLTELQDHLDIIQKFVNQKGIFIGGLVYIGFFTICIVFLIPVTIPTILGGIIFKLWFGILFIWIASLLGGTIAFLLGRYVFRKPIVKRIEGNKKLVAVDQAIGQEGWKIVLLLRLTPIIPESLLNYALAVTKIRLTHYLASSAVGLLPGCSFFVYMGTMIGNIADIGKRHIQKGEIAMYVISGVAMIFTILFITFIVKRAVNKKLEIEESKGLLDEEARIASEDQEEEKDQPHQPSNNILDNDILRDDVDELVDNQQYSPSLVKP